MEKIITMPSDFLFGEVYINKVWATPRDKFRFCDDYGNGRVKARIYRYNGIIDIETE